MMVIDGGLNNGGPMLDDLLSSSRNRVFSNAFSFWKALSPSCKEATEKAQMACVVDTLVPVTSVSKSSMKSLADKSERN